MKLEVKKIYIILNAPLDTSVKSTVEISNISPDCPQMSFRVDCDFSEIKPKLEEYILG